MCKAIIWDLDGTLLDSYSVIVESLYLALGEFGVPMSREDIFQYAIEYSSSALIKKVVAEYGLSSQDIFDRYGQISGPKYLDIIPMPHALEVLDVLKKQGVTHFVYTHRGRTTLPVLKNLGMDHFFAEILTSQSGFSRKPEPQAITYLMEKYELEPASTYYAGDRTLDMECAQNAGIQGILYLPKDSKASPSGAESYIVDDLLDIAKII